MESVSSLYVPPKLGIHYLDVLHNLLQYHEVIIFDCTSDLPVTERVVKVNTLEDMQNYFDDFGPDRYYALMFVEPPPEAESWLKRLPKHKYYWRMTRDEYYQFVQRYPRLLNTLDNDPYCILPQLYITRYSVARSLYESEDRHKVITKIDGPMETIVEEGEEELARWGRSRDNSQAVVDRPSAAPPMLVTPIDETDEGLIDPSIVYVNVTHHNAEIGDYAFPIHDANDEDLVSVIRSVVSIYEKEVEQLGKTMVIYCDKGQSRSGSIVLYLVCRVCQVSLDEAWAMINVVYPDISPNPGFTQQLRHLLEAESP